MSTIHAIHTDMAAGASALQPLDELAVWENSTGLPKKLTGNQIAGGAAALVALTAGATVLTLTQAAHAGRTVTIASTTPIAITLPVSSGSNSVYRIVLMTAATATGHTITATTTQVIQGAIIAQTTSNAALSWSATATDNTITMNGTTQGGLFGTTFELRDVKTGVWQLLGHTNTSGAAATLLSHV